MGASVSLRHLKWQNQRQEAKQGLLGAREDRVGSYCLMSREFICEIM